jgi:hypothetical protein
VVSVRLLCCEVILPSPCTLEGNHHLKHTIWSG